MSLALKFAEPLIMQHLYKNREVFFKLFVASDSFILGTLYKCVQSFLVIYYSLTGHIMFMLTYLLITCYLFLV